MSDGVIRMAMVGGGPGSFIGPVHRMAAELDGRIRLVAGAFSRDEGKSKAAARGYGIDPARAYGDYRQMLAAEAARPDGAQFVAIVTPNHVHFPVAKAALEAGFSVLSDKPATATLDEAEDLARVVADTRRLYGLTYTYTGYPLVREARAIVQRGDLGAIRKVVVEYSQGWLAEAVEKTDNAQAAWRADPARSGLGGCIGDIGVHAFNLAEFVSGLAVTRLNADLNSVVPGRRLDDDCNILLRFGEDVPGVLVASQVAAGDRNSLRLRVYGAQGGLDWCHERPDVLTINWLDRPTQTLHAAAPYLGPAGRGPARLPTGHPEGFIEAFANIYRDFATAIASGGGLGGTPVPTIQDGLRGMAFVARAVAANGAGWVDL
ncbi:Gfo/Idh/MocA family protein [Nitrospirillum amazonense]|uniref:Putative dehydrogenase n=1 Tax=Nitrospirillum amazonense TaxID=28077 RepID=A0A560K7L9_9PROT|nr:Gfo/Idh/MocA family oxidoreductase [Nitrospirillum amazonense]MDG3444240.1 Gfo/Idh/MocA family oxidoreductase [Nitrospirillum amazonense]TWB77794.1 putative dehydrogenase [Nitrospirillum amazonense]